jgi:hypothetical protein
MSQAAGKRGRGIFYNMEILKEALSDIPADIAEGAKTELFSQWNASAVQADARQHLIAADHAKQDLRSIEGVGALSLSVDPQIYHFWNWKLPGCWRDSDFIAWFKRNFPQCVVKCGGTGKTMLLMPGLKAA